jgi:hypothetical protein
LGNTAAKKDLMVKACPDYYHELNNERIKILLTEEKLS